MACLLGRDQMNLTLLSLHCAIANRFMNFRHREGEGQAVVDAKNADFIGHETSSTKPSVEEGGSCCAT